MPFPVNASIISVNRKPSIANLPFQFSAEDVNPHTQGKNVPPFSINSHKRNF